KESLKDDTGSDDGPFMVAPFNYFAPQEGDKPGVYWFSLGRDSNGGHTCTPACPEEEYGAYTYDDIRDVVIVTEKGAYHQTIKREDIKKECKKLFDERKSYCVNKAHFSLDDKEEPVVVLAGLPKKRDVSFQNFESREGTKDEIKQLIEKDEGKVVAC